MSDPLTSEHAEPEALVQMRKLKGARWAAYQNMDLGSSQVGHLRFLAIGPDHTFKEPPTRYPDTQHGTGWAYLFAGWVDLETGEIRRENKA